MHFLLLPSAVFWTLSWVAGQTSGGDFQKPLDAAMAPYYGALVATARGNIEASQRQLLLFESAWEAVVRQGRNQAPAPLAADGEWDKVLASGTAAIREARQRITRHDVAGAHSDLEGIRLALRQIRGRHNLLTFDDHLTDFHDGMERAVGHVGGRNEIVLRDKDFDDIREDLEAAREAWKRAQASAGAVVSQSGWAAAARQITVSLDEADRAAATRDADTTSKILAGLHDRYYDLLLVLSHATRS